MTTQNRRQKASDVFNEANFFMGQKVGFEAAFPQIDDIRVEVEENGDGVDKWNEKRFYGKSSGEFINCSNPQCYNGGFSLGNILRAMVRKNQTEDESTAFCQGYEGSPKGRRKSQDCMNHFKIKVSIKYKSENPE